MTEHTISVAQIRDAIKRVEAGGHSVFAPSSSKMWLNCAGSLIPNLLAPDDAGEDAAYGSVGHMVGETWLRSGRKPTHLLGTHQWIETGGWEYSILIDEVMMDYVEQYVSWCRDLDGDHFTEVRVDFSEITPIPNQGGTADHAACSWQTLVITDLKMGKGIWVYAKGNTQARLYALGFFLEWDWLYNFQKIVIRIAQPRLNNWDVWIISREELLEFAEEARRGAAAAWKHNAARTPSAEACEWCRVAATCTARAKATFDMTRGAFDDLGINQGEMVEFKEELNDGLTVDPVDPANLSTFELEQVFSQRGAIEKFLKKCGEELTRRMKQGTKLKLFKEVEGRSFRAFKSRPAAVAALVNLGLKQSDVLKEELISPAQAEELLLKLGYKKKELPELLNDLVIRPPGKATIAPIKDGRPALSERYEDAFSDLS